MKRDCDLRVREHTFNVGDLVYWRVKLAKRLNLHGEDPELSFRSNSVYIVKSFWEQKVMHHDQLKFCESRHLPKLLVDFQGAKCRGTSNLPDSSKNNGNGQCVGDSLNPKLQGKNDQASVPDSP